MADADIECGAASGTLTGDADQRQQPIRASLDGLHVDLNLFEHLAPLDEEGDHGLAALPGALAGAGIGDPLHIGREQAPASFGVPSGPSFVQVADLLLFHRDAWSNISGSCEQNSSTSEPWSRRSS